MKSIGLTLQRTYLTKKVQKETLCNIQLTVVIFLHKESTIERLKLQDLI